IPCLCGKGPNVTTKRKTRARQHHVSLHLWQSAILPSARCAWSHHRRMSNIAGPQAARGVTSLGRANYSHGESIRSCHTVADRTTHLLPLSAEGPYSHELS